ncbi:protease modulator HflC [Echinimonas agarilytica]|uniref:Protein HflC n=1 Tax=Echinimonas agarilytica TaxID=1215918 RepID=A0AA41W4C4_9GAMM|nr:protease modulator HflC [Echinimonas agarilytica]MCM2678468.1 protease modulator HflC [Echinimonas agarilytica]
MRPLVLVLIAVFALAGYSSLFVVNEGERGISIRFGKVLRDAQTAETVVFEPGLHVKIPFIDNVRYLNARVQTLDDRADRFVTSEKKDLIVDSYVKWRISDFSKFYLSTRGDIFKAESLLKRRISNGLRTEFGARTIKEIVSGARSELMEKALSQVAEGAQELGIEVIDVRVKQINLPPEVSESIYDRMRAERTAVAREHRSEGREQAEAIRADVDARVTVMLADAERQAREQRGTGDAEAAKIYADSYGQDPEFYEFFRSMQAYRTSFGQSGDMMVIQPDSEFFKYMKNPTGK